MIQRSTCHDSMDSKKRKLLLGSDGQISEITVAWAIGQKRSLVTTNPERNLVYVIAKCLIAP